MKNISRALMALGLLAGFSACGGDDSDNKTVVDAGGSIFQVDSGTKDSGTPSMDAAVADTGTTTPTSDGGTSTTTPDAGTPSGADCFSGTPTKMEDFLNRCTNAQTANKPTLGVPAALLAADGGVLPL